MKQILLAATLLVGIISTARGEPGEEKPFQWGSGIKVLIVTGGYWHDFEGLFVNKDSATLREAGITSIHWTTNSAVAARELPHADVFLESANYMGFDTSAFREAVSNFVNAGKGVVLVHSGVWLNWPWPEYYSTIVGGFSRDHDGKAPFTVKVVEPDSPIMKGVPASFPVTDELYHSISATNGSPMEILTKTSRPGSPGYASVWIVHHPKARVVGIALGHDADTHNSPDYQKILVNAVKWAGGK